MILTKRYKGTNYKEYYCEITEELDNLSGVLKISEVFDLRHYILADDFCVNRKCLAIRIPGGTVGGVWIDDKNVITKIKVDTDYVVKSYPKDVNEKAQKYVGQSIEFETK